MITGAEVQGDGFRLMDAGLEADGAVSAGGGGLFQGAEHGPGEAAAAVFPRPDEHALEFRYTVAEGTDGAAGDVHAREPAQQKNSAGAAELRGIDSVNGETGIALFQFGVERGDEGGGLGEAGSASTMASVGAI